MIRDLVDRLYAALAAGDRAAVEALLAPRFTAQFTDGLPVGGGRHAGAAAIDDGWWALGRAYEIRTEASEYIPTADGRLLVVGRYRGRVRGGRGGTVDAQFAHLWGADAGRLTSLLQITDSASWPPARHAARRAGRGDEA